MMIAIGAATPGELPGESWLDAHSLLHVGRP